MRTPGGYRAVGRTGGWQPAQVCSDNPLGGQCHSTLMPTACTHGCTPGLGSIPHLCPRPLLKGSTVCLGFLPPPNQDEPSTDSTIKKTILCSLVAPGDRHPDAERLLASWPDGGCCHPPTLTDHRRRGLPQDQGSVLPCTCSVGGADTVGDSYAAQRTTCPVLTAAYCAH